MSSTNVSQVAAFLTTLSVPTPHTTFLNSIISGLSRPQPLPALAATAKHRLLNSDIGCTSTPILASATPSLPADISNIRKQSTVLPYDVFVQLLDIEDIGRSKWDQVESLESERKGETTKGREIIRVVPTADEESSLRTSQAPETQPRKDKRSHGPYKLVLQDCKGNKVWAFELKKIDKLGYPPTINIGCKLWVKKGCKVARGVLLIEPTTVEIVGGKIEGIDKAWREGRENRLRDILKGPPVAIWVSNQSILEAFNGDLNPSDSF